MVAKLTDMIGQIQQEKLGKEPIKKAPIVSESDKLRKYIDRGEKVAEIQNEIHSVLAPVVEEEPEVEKELVDNVSVEKTEDVPEISFETRLLLEAFERLIDRIEKLEAPVIHLPPSEIIIQMPDLKRSVLKIVERDEKGQISSIHETTTEIPESKPLVESREKKKPNRKK